LWPIERLRPYERNPRTHSEAQVDQIAASMVEFGWTNPILVDENAGMWPAMAQVFRLARDERDAWVNWPARVAAMMAAELEIDPHQLHTVLERDVREHLGGLAEVRPSLLSQRASSEPGRWHTERTPYLKEIMDCLSPSSPVQRVALMKGAQIGGTECGNCWIGYGRRPGRTPVP